MLGSTHIVYHLSVDRQTKNNINKYKQTLFHVHLSNFQNVIKNYLESKLELQLTANEFYRNVRTFKQSGTYVLQVHHSDI